MTESNKRQKTKQAIEKAMNSSSGIYEDGQADRIAKEIEDYAKEMHKEMTIYAIEDQVYYRLIQANNPATARAYENYKTIQAFKRQTNTTDTDVFGLLDNTNFDVLAEKAKAGLDLALGRGGDQVVVYEKDGTPHFYGGKSQSVEKATRVRARDPQGLHRRHHQHDPRCRPQPAPGLEEARARGCFPTWRHRPHANCAGDRPHGGPQPRHAGRHQGKALRHPASPHHPHLRCRGRQRLH